MEEVTVGGTCVLFDLDDTLLDHSGAAREAVLACAARWGLADDGRLEERWRVLERHYYRRFQARELTLHEQRRARIRGFLGDQELGDETADRLFEDYWSLYRSSWRAFPGAGEALDRARAAGLVVAILTNGRRSDQVAKVHMTGLERPDVRVVASSDLRVAKPSPIAFEQTCELLGVRAGRSTTMVGDAWENDIVGARAAELEAVYLHREGPTGLTDPVPQIMDLAQLRFVARRC